MVVLRRHSSVCVCHVLECVFAWGNKSTLNHEPPRQEDGRIRCHHLTCHESRVFDSVPLACAPTHSGPSQIYWSAVVLCHHVAKTDQLNNKDLLNTRCFFSTSFFSFSSTNVYKILHIEIHKLSIPNDLKPKAKQPFKSFI